MTAQSALEDHFFSRGPIDGTKQGDDDSDKIFCGVGRALAAWEDVEERLSIWFLTLAKAESDEQAEILYRAFGAVGSPEAKIEILRAASRAYFANDWHRKEIGGIFEQVAKAIRGASHRRNEIAHCRIGNFNGWVVTDPLNVLQKIDKGLFLIPPRYASKHNEAPPKKWTENLLATYGNLYAYNSADLHTFRGKFLQLSQELNLYIESLIPDETGVPRCLRAARKEGDRKATEREARKASRKKSS
jgi:hypothetical protein